MFERKIRKLTVCILGLLLLLFTYHVYVSSGHHWLLDAMGKSITRSNTEPHPVVIQRPYPRHLTAGFVSIHQTPSQLSNMPNGSSTVQQTAPHRSYLPNRILTIQKSDSQLSQDVHQTRLHQIEKTCSDNVSGAVYRLFQFHNVAYCATYKIASTFWTRIYRYLYNDTNRGHVNSPFDISKFETQIDGFKHVQYMSLGRVSNSLRFMFVREPFARLWSVYIDKFILPDAIFWSRYGTAIKALRLASQSRAFCDAVSFPEFIKFIVKYGTLNPNALDDHYRPIHYGCNPCKYKPSFVGKIETMADDSRYILTRLGLAWVSDIHSGEERIREELSMLINFSYDILATNKRMRTCVSSTSTAEKLWQAFQLNGYLPPNIKPTLSEKDLQDRNQFIKHVWNTFKSANRTSKMIRSQRQTMKGNAYKEVPMDALRGIQAIFKKDFELFGYDPEPEDIFGKSAL